MTMATGSVWATRGKFDLGAATAGCVTAGREPRHRRPHQRGSASACPKPSSASFFDLVLKGKIEKDWLEMFRPILAALSQPAYGTTVPDYTKPPHRSRRHLPWATYQEHLPQRLLWRSPEVVDQDGALLLRIGPKMNSFALRHWDCDIFIYTSRKERWPRRTERGYTFLVGPGRKAARAVVENLDVHGQGARSRDSQPRSDPRGNDSRGKLSP